MALLGRFLSPCTRRNAGIDPSRCGCFFLEGKESSFFKKTPPGLVEKSYLPNKNLRNLLSSHGGKKVELDRGGRSREGG